MEEKKELVGRGTSESFAEFVQILRQENVNGAGRLFGGHLMAWMDEVAAVSARRYAKGPVTTACVEELRFLRPAFSNETMVVHGQVVRTGHTSMEVLVNAYVERLDGERELIADAHFILVALDESEKEKRAIPPVIAENDEEQALLDAAKARHMERTPEKNKL
ncbi:MAG: acyl-CoA thioesterase [Ruminococcaceae bacterium]|nr:acyl-CoA thioesterase [Oscillospiraceae bacterium]